MLGDVAWRSSIVWGWRWAGHQTGQWCLVKHTDIHTDLSHSDTFGLWLDFGSVNRDPLVSSVVFIRQRDIKNHANAIFQTDHKWEHSPQCDWNLPSSTITMEPCSFQGFFLLFIYSYLYICQEWVSSWGSSALLHLISSHYETASNVSVPLFCASRHNGSERSKETVGRSPDASIETNCGQQWPIHLFQTTHPVVQGLLFWR